MNENNFVNNQENNTTQVTTEPVVNTTPVESAPVQPVETVTPISPVEEEKPKKKSKILPILVILIIILLLLGGASYYLFVVNTNNPVYNFLFNKNNASGNTTTTTTTTTTAAIDVNPEKEIKLLDIKSLDDYANIAKDKLTTTAQNFPSLIDDSFYELDYNLKGKCKNDGDKVSFDIKQSKINYTCKTVDICGTDPDCKPESPVWDAEGTVNSKYKFTESSYSTCNTSKHYTNGKYYLTDTHSCGVGDEKIYVADENNNKILDTRYENMYIKKYNSSTDREEYNVPVIIKDNILYFVAADLTEKDGYSTCRVKYIDFNKETKEVKDLNVTGECYIFVE